MGYNTHFEGTVTFTGELTILQLRKFNTFLDKEVEDLPPSFPTFNGHSIGLEMNKKYTGLKWNTQEKTYDMAGQLNAIEEFMNITLKGELYFSNDYYEVGYIRRGKDDKWQEFISPREMVTTCPHCGKNIYKDEV